MTRRPILRILVAAVVVVLVVLAVMLAQLRPQPLRERIASALALRFNADVSIDTFDVDIVPRLRLNGSGIRLRIRNRPDLPPFISIDHFWMDLQPLSIVRRHVDTVHLDGLKIQVPPDDARDTLHNGRLTSEESLLSPSKVLIEHLIAHDAELSFVSNKPRHRPHLFPIRWLELTQVGFDRAFPFRAELTNPVPVGLIQTTGTFGPWIKDDPARTPVRGTYVFSDADLATIDGIHGMLSSQGTFGGRLAAIDVAGTTSTPDFNLDLGGKALPLQTTFSATVDGTNGTTILRHISGTLRKSSIVASGAVVNLPGPGRHSIDLDVSVPRGRLEDLLALVSPNGQSAANGNIALKSAVHLPPGHSSTLSRLKLDGQFTLTGTTFKNTVQQRIREFSRRTQGKSADDMDARVVSDIRGGFVLTDGVMQLRDLAFAVPGATVELNGSCNLRNRALDLQGTLTMEASVSKAVGGFKSIFLKMFDPFFRKPGKGTVIPIKIGGTIEAPKPALNFQRK